MDVEYEHVVIWIVAFPHTFLGNLALFLTPVDSEESHD